VYWHAINPKVKLIYVPDSAEGHLPDADVIFATAWHTVRSVLECSSVKGEKCYLIQGYETFQGPEELVQTTWRASLHKVVVSKWLLEIGKALNCEDLTHIPNAIDDRQYCVLQPIENRLRRVVMPFSLVEVKGAADGIKALEIAKVEYPDMRASLFGSGRRASWIPKWIEYFRDPTQDFIVKELYNNSSIVLSPSWAEGFALPPAEGAACGCAIVATDSGGIRDFVDNGVTGLLSPARDPTALAANLSLLLGNEDLRVRLAKAGKTFVTRLNWERSANLLEEFITSVVQKKRLEAQTINAT
jgi:glycosyltransferase involved in cell wall biosynthesis